METIVVDWGHIREWKENGNYCSILGAYRGMEKKMETIVVYWGHIGEWKRTWKLL